MSKFHINKNGVPAQCRAQAGKCPLGGASGSENHFDSQQDAQKAADQINQSEHGLLPSSIAGDKSGKMSKQEEFMRALRDLRDPNVQYKLAEKKTEDVRRAYKEAESVFKSANNPEDRRIAGYDLMKAERKLKESEDRLSKKKDDLNIE